MFHHSAAIASTANPAVQRSDNSVPVTVRICAFLAAAGEAYDMDGSDKILEALCSGQTHVELNAEEFSELIQDAYQHVEYPEEPWHSEVEAAKLFIKNY